MDTAFITGNRVYLRALQQEDLAACLLPWYNNREVTRYLFRGTYPSQLEGLQRDYQAALQSAKDIELMVVLAEERQAIGIIGLHGINGVAHSAELRILMGDSSQWGKGYGTEATQLMLAYAFELLNLHKVYLGVNAAQANAIRVYEKSGLVREGQLRDEIYRNGRYYDAVRMSILRHEYQQQKATWAIFGAIERQFLASA